MNKSHYRFGEQMRLVAWRDLRDVQRRLGWEVLVAATIAALAGLMAPLMPLRMLEWGLWVCAAISLLLGIVAALNWWMARDSRRRLER